MQSHIRVLLQVPDAQILIQLTANAQGKAVEEGSSTWDPAPHVGDPGVAFRLLVLVIMAIWGED